MTRSTSQLQDSLGYQFNELSILQRALTHRSYASVHNERLEFLGDSVLNCAVSILLYEQYPDLDEGKLSRVRSHLVKQDCLAEVGRRMGLDHYLFLGTGEIKSSPVIKDSIIADALEAVFGAVLLDSCFDTARDCVIGLIRPVLDSKPIEFLGKDPKTRLQEHLQARRFQLPAYEVLVEGGTSVSPEFHVRCHVAQLDLAKEGTGHSRRLAEQRAAEAVLMDLLEQDYADPNTRGKNR